MNGQIIGNKPVKCAWGRHQPRQSQVPAIQMLHVQYQMQNELAFLGPQGMLSPMRHMIQMPGAMQMPTQLQNLGLPQLLHPQNAQQALQQQGLLSSMGLWSHS